LLLFADRTQRTQAASFHFALAPLVTLPSASNLEPNAVPFDYSREPRAIAVAVLLDSRLQVTATAEVMFRVAIRPIEVQQINDERLHASKA